MRPAAAGERAAEGRGTGFDGAAVKRSLPMVAFNRQPATFLPGRNGTQIPMPAGRLGPRSPRSMTRLLPPFFLAAAGGQLDAPATTLVGGAILVPHSPLPW